MRLLEIYKKELALKKDTIKWQCTYKIDQLEKPAAQRFDFLSITDQGRKIEYRNVTKLVVPESSGSGAFRMSFALFEDSNYTVPMSKTPNLHKECLSS